FTSISCSLKILTVMWDPLPLKPATVRSLGIETGIETSTEVGKVENITTIGSKMVAGNRQWC
ncbi:MAG: hypothetical protein QXW46_07270, partial [Sulfolobales archaeon]